MGTKRCNSLGAITLFTHSASGFHNRREIPVISSHKAYSQWTNNGIKGNTAILRRKWVMDSKINDKWPPWNPIQIFKVKLSESL